MLVRKEIMYETINVLNSGFFYSTGMQHEKYLFYKVLSHRLIRRKGRRSGEKTQKAPD